MLNIGPAEQSISRNMDRSRMLAIGKLHDDGHVPCRVINSGTTYTLQYEGVVHL